ncbi:hypothetical protein HPP92_025038 [Vanilla planifolia]|uniref:Uncharacterized protein n=1 Tax=Vanilla planifolia TaxID=51239 RepID=A0A835PL44_VANPL|nr:hypothetical protein HPP92_025038 [Vanilla planifolia]
MEIKQRPYQQPSVQQFPPPTSTTASPATTPCAPKPLRVLLRVQGLDLPSRGRIGRLCLFGSLPSSPPNRSPSSPTVSWPPTAHSWVVRDRCGEAAPDSPADAGEDRQDHRGGVADGGAVERRGGRCFVTHCGWNSTMEGLAGSAHGGGCRSGRIQLTDAKGEELRLGGGRLSGGRRVVGRWTPVEPDRNVVEFLKGVASRRETERAVTEELISTNMVIEKLWRRKWEIRPRRDVATPTTPRPFFKHGPCSSHLRPVSTFLGQLPIGHLHLAALSNTSITLHIARHSSSSAACPYPAGLQTGSSLESVERVSLLGGTLDGQVGSVGLQASPRRPPLPRRRNEPEVSRRKGDLRTDVGEQRALPRGGGVWGVRVRG